MPLLQAVSEAVERDGYHAAGFLAYEAAPGFDPALRVRDAGTFPLAWFGLYSAPEALDALPSPDATRPPALPELNWQPSINSTEYRKNIARIRELIRTGHTYQVNFSYRLRSAKLTEAWPVFLDLMRAGEASLGAYVDIGDWVILSASPELFFRLEGNELVSRPMKGTTARGLWTEQDREMAEQLSTSPKDRAENVMIVDMVRHDLGKVAVPGSVTVPELFAIERHPTVWQMTSTVRAHTDAPLKTIFQALFPAASITGAPKCHTMEIIADLENSARRIYTGTVGYLAPGRQAQFNVAIRTILLDRQSGIAEYGVGGGIVWDSKAEGEEQECQIKSRVLRARRPSFDLLETMHWCPAEGYALLEFHLRRLAASAEYFGFAVDLVQVEEHLHNFVGRLPRVPQKIRLLVNRHGGFKTEATLFEETGFADVVLAHEPIDSHNPFLYHKTTHRAVYEAALRGRPGFKDVLLFNEQQEITESTIANIAIEENGILYTPPLHCGLLPGVRRAALLESDQVRERVIRVDDVLRARSVYLFNALRGMHEVKVKWE